MNHASSILLLAAIAMTMVSCSHERFAPRAPSILDVPANYVGKTVDDVSDWRSCQDLGLPKLTALLTQMSEENFQLREAMARIDAAQAVAEQTGAARWPRLQASAEASRSDTGSTGPGRRIPGQRLPGGSSAGAGVGTDEGSADNQYQAALSASYELDLWNRLASRYEAAVFDAAASRYSWDSLRISLGASLAEVWANLIAQRSLLRVYAQQLDVSRDYVELTELRYGMGSGSALDVTQQRQQLESLQGEVAQARGRREALSAQLNTLLGEIPGGELYPAIADLPSLPELPTQGVPLELLEQRPDVRAAFLRLQAADARSAAAVADRLPGLQLSGNVFSFARQTSELFDTLFWDIAASLSTVIFDAGQLAAAVDAAESRAEAQLYVYAQTLLTALEDVKSALALSRAQADLIASLEAQQEEAQRALSLARTAYVQGASDYLRVLTTLQSLQQLQRGLIQARQQQFAYGIQLCRSLGFGPGLKLVKRGEHKSVSETAEREQ
ncbi:efflux transporter outer membrane subunit [Proteobacteria bacterium 005FR1]|nr:efflux transporter outer membrane subunit [Proteobacteria bacterium 005FR1]